jgi:hypothetical protein
MSGMIGNKAVGRNGTDLRRSCLSAASRTTRFLARRQIGYGALSVSLSWADRTRTTAPSVDALESASYQRPTPCKRPLGQCHGTVGRRFPVYCSLIALFFCALAQSAEAPKAVFAKKHVAFLDNYCMDCHDAETEKGEVNLEDLPFQIGTIEHAERWQDVLAAINSGEMPPKKKKQPKSDEKADFLEDLSNTMVTARQILSDSGGKIVMRRLNKREYQNSIESLVGVQLDENDLPSDGGSGDFDTVGASLFISGDKFEQYLSLGRKAVDEFYAQRAAQNAKPFVMRIEPETIFNPQMDAKMANYDKVRANFTGLKKAVDAFIALPKNKAAVAKISKRQRSSLKSFYKVLATYKGAPNAAKYGFRGGLFGAAKSYEDATTNYGYNKQFADLPNRENGAYLQMPVGYTNIPLAPKRMPVGRYKLRVSAGAVAGSPGYRNFLELGHPTHNVQPRAPPPRRPRSWRLRRSSVPPESSRRYAPAPARIRQRRHSGDSHHRIHPRPCGRHKD